MIKNIADLLEQLKTAEKKKIDELGIKHRSTIGNTYEGLTAELLNRVVFEHLNLKIVKNSFIKTDTGVRSGEMDIMIIEGEPEKLLYTTDQYDVRFEQVIAIIQVKKKLNRDQIESGYDNLKSAYDLNDFEHTAPPYALKLFRDAYTSICLEDIIERKKFRKSFSSTTKEQIFHMLRLEAMMPARIIFGYEGYTSEYGLRKGFIEFLQENKSEIDNFKTGFGPLNYPDLIINGNYSLVKGNGMPYPGPLIDDQWNFYFSSGHSPLYKLLEIIWTRLDYRYKLDPMIYGEDLEKEGVHMFLKANLVNVEGLRGWNINYTEISKKDLEKEHGAEFWEPVLLTDEQHHIIAMLCKHGSVAIDKINDLQKMIGKEVNITEFVEGIVRTGLVYVDRTELKLLTKKCQVLYIPKEGWYAGDNYSGRMTRWLENKRGKIKNVLHVTTHDH